MPHERHVKVRFLCPYVELYWSLGTLICRVRYDPARTRTALRHSRFSFHLFFISWRLITLQYCSGFCHT